MAGIGWDPTWSSAGFTRIEPRLALAVGRFRPVWGLRKCLGYRQIVRYRLIYAGLALLVLAAVALGTVLAMEGEEIDLPAPIEAVSPSPGDRVIRQAAVEVDMAIGYEATLYVDGLPVPDAAYVPATGLYSWAPHPNSAIFTEWTPGDHTVRVEWIRTSGTPDVGSFEWSFRVQ
jgi:hypothetical protein